MGPTVALWYVTFFSNYAGCTRKQCEQLGRSRDYQYKVNYETGSRIHHCLAPGAEPMYKLHNRQSDALCPYSAFDEDSFSIHTTIAVKGRYALRSLR